MHAKNSPIVDGLNQEKEKFYIRRKSLALILVGLMVVSSMAMVLPALLKDGNAIAGDVPVKIAANNGQREVTWTISNMFEMYLPDSDWNRTGGITFEDVGRHPGTDGMPGWFYLRDPKYGEKILRNTYPHIFYYNPYSTVNSVIPYNVGYNIWAPYRMTIEARNVTDCNTRNDAIYVPDLDPLGTIAPNGGWINMSWYGTYMTTNEVGAARSGTHFANWLFGVPTGMTQRTTADDGYFFQLLGKIHYSRDAAMSYLGWDGTGDVRTWFNANVGGLTGLKAQWENDWIDEGSNQYDIYTCYDFSEDIKWTQLKVDDQNSTASEITVLCWTQSWGMDAQIVRYMEAANITKKGFQNWMEDMYLNISVSPSMSNTSCRATSNYHMEAWEDPSNSVWSAAWEIEMQHMDWAGNDGVHTGYLSPYNPVDPDQHPDVVRKAWVPWATSYGGDVTYWIAPREQDLATYEKIVLTLPTRDIIGFIPAKGTSDSLNGPAKYNELASKEIWGVAAFGLGQYPQATLRNAYDSDTKTCTLTGPIDFPNESLAGNLLHGVPNFIIDVSKVAEYDITTSLPTNEFSPDVAFTLTVTAKNGTGAVVTDWNGTVNLVSSDPSHTTMVSSHTFVPGDNGVWSQSVTITAGSALTVDIDATDQWYDLDVDGSTTVYLVPEFSTMLIPVVGAIAIFLVFRTKKRREEIE